MESVELLGTCQVPVCGEGREGEREREREREREGERERERSGGVSQAVTNVCTHLPRSQPPHRPISQQTFPLSGSYLLRYHCQEATG